MLTRPARQSDCRTVGRSGENQVRTEQSLLLVSPWPSFMCLLSLSLHLQADGTETQSKAQILFLTTDFDGWEDKMFGKTIYFALLTSQQSEGNHWGADIRCLAQQLWDTGWGGGAGWGDNHGVMAPHLTGLQSVVSLSATKFSLDFVNCAGLGLVMLILTGRQSWGRDEKRWEASKSQILVILIATCLSVLSQIFSVLAVSV